LLELPLAPSCREIDGRECALVATAGVSFEEPEAEPTDAPADPRWAVLSELEL
jgi:uncharacterized metal-binding protein YceD (DUF177 family)